MAIYRYTAKVIRRSQGRSAVQAAAYRSGIAMRDERTGKLHTPTSRIDVVHSEVLLPLGAPTRFTDRQVLWNAVEKAERRRDAQVAREILLTLPRELDHDQQVAVVRRFATEQFISQGMVADINVHVPKASDGHKQPHAHVMLTMRGLMPASSSERRDGDFGPKMRAWNSRGFLSRWRQRWAEVLNMGLATAGHDVRVHHESLASRGIQLEPQVEVGLKAKRRPGCEWTAQREADLAATKRHNGEKLLDEPGIVLQIVRQERNTYTQMQVAEVVRRHVAADQVEAVMARVVGLPDFRCTSAEPSSDVEAARCLERAVLAYARQWHVAQDQDAPWRFPDSLLVQERELDARVSGLAAMVRRVLEREPNLAADIVAGGGSEALQQRLAEDWAQRLAKRAAKAEALHREATRAICSPPAPPLLASKPVTTSLLRKQAPFDPARRSMAPTPSGP